VLGVTAQDIRRAARAVLDPSRANLVLVGDADEKMRREMSAQLRRFRQQLKAGARVRVPVAAPSLRAPVTPRRRAGVLDLPAASP
jgi:predicted Zn-dependent peptidase